MDARSVVNASSLQLMSEPIAPGSRKLKEEIAATSGIGREGMPTSREGCWKNMRATQHQANRCGELPRGVAAAIAGVVAAEVAANLVH